LSGSLALGIDIGTSGVRAAFMGLDGVVRGQASEKLSDHGDNPRSPATWLRALQTLMARAGQEFALNQIGAVAIDGTSGTVLGLDAEGTPVGDALMYNDSVDDPLVPASIGRVAPRESAAHGPASALARAIVLQNRPGVVRIVHQADWIAEQLADGPVPTDESNALKTGYDPIARAWPDWLSETLLNTALLPEVVPAGSRSGTLGGTFDLPTGAALVAGVTDGCASFLATGASRPGDGVTALGTTMTLKLLSDRPVFAPEFGIYSHRIGDMWLAGGASNSGGGVLAAFFTPDELVRLSDCMDTRTPTGLDFYPLTRPGERFPVADPGLMPRLEPRPDDEGLFLQAMLEGLARIEAIGYSRLEELGAPKLRTLRTVGGGARNRAWRTLRQNALGLADTPAQFEDAAVGAACLAKDWLSE